MKMDEVAPLVSDVDDGLRERLDEEIYAFNVAATGHADGRPLGIAVRGDGGDLRAGLSEWRSRKCSAAAAIRWS
jgi:hypothetical protein